MTKVQVLGAISTGLPFTLIMADGREYSVPHPDYISVHPKSSCVFVFDYNGGFTILPLLTMTGLRSSGSIKE